MISQRARWDRFGVLPDQNGWSRYLHFEAAWALVLTGVIYLIAGLSTRHFRKDLYDRAADFQIQRHHRRATIQKQKSLDQNSSTIFRSPAVTAPHDCQRT